MEIKQIKKKKIVIDEKLEDNISGDSISGNGTAGKGFRSKIGENENIKV